MANMKSCFEIHGFTKIAGRKSGAKEPENETDFTAISVAALNLQCRKLEDSCWKSKKGICSRRIKKGNGETQYSLL